MELLKAADIVIADLNAFRGHEPDSGTVWECGFAYAMGKKVYGYMSDTRPMRSRFDWAENDSNGFHIEDWDLPVNLELSFSADAIVEGSLEDVLKYLTNST